MFRIKNPYEDIFKDEECRMRKYIKDLLIAVNSSQNIFKYPIGNVELTEKLKLLEFQGQIYFDDTSMTWKRGSK